MVTIDTYGLMLRTRSGRMTVRRCGILFFVLLHVQVCAAKCVTNTRVDVTLNFLNTLLGPVADWTRGYTQSNADDESVG